MTCRSAGGEWMGAPVSRTGGRGTLAEINVTPLVDVMLVLLVIFMVTAPMMHRGVDVTLPSADVSTEPREQTLLVTVDRNGDLWLGNEPVHEELLAVRVDEARKKTGHDFVYLQADASIPYGRVMFVMDQCRKGGIGEVGLVIQPRGSKGKGS
ncbi:MAG: ExbD/TolR family protein [Acidobacteriota bacterium]